MTAPKRLRLAPWTLPRLSVLGAALVLAASGCSSAPPPPSAAKVLAAGQFIVSTRGMRITTMAGSSTNLTTNGIYTAAVRVVFSDPAGNEIQAYTQGPDGFFVIAGGRPGVYTLTTFELNSDIHWLVRLRTPLSFTLQEGEVSNMGRVVFVAAPGTPGSIGVAGSYPLVQAEFAQRYPTAEWNTYRWRESTDSNLSISSVSTAMAVAVGRFPDLPTGAAALSSLFPGAAFAAQNRSIDELSLAAWEVKKITDNLGGTGDAPTPDTTSAAPGAVSYPYTGAGSAAARTLLSKVTGWTLQTPPKLDPPDGSRDILVVSAILSAWGTEALAARGAPDQAGALAAAMMVDLQRAYAIGFGSPASSAGNYIHDDELAALLAKG